MTVLTRDIIVHGIRREDVLTWLSNFSVHSQFLVAGFPACKTIDATTIELPFYGGYKDRILTYKFDRVDSEHEGRRVEITTHGKRVEGVLHYSLRTVKPSTDTMITLHMDYDSGGLLGSLLQSDIHSALSQAFMKCLEALKAKIEKELRST